MTKYIEIVNDGLIEPDAISLMGASTKDGKSTIGMFGSGNKYALAYLLRKDIKLRIFSGIDEILVEKLQREFRDKKFDVIYINGEKTSLTTQTGEKSWELWMAIREFYANALDEGGAAMTQSMNINPEPNKTKIYIDAKHHEVLEFVKNIRQYFPSSSSILYEDENGRVYDKLTESTHIYRRGMPMFDSRHTSRYNYDLKNVKLDENRKPMYSWEIYENFWKFVFNMKDLEIMEEIFVASGAENSFEGSVSNISNIERTTNTNVKLVADKLNAIPKEYAGMLEPDELEMKTMIPKKVFVAIYGEKELFGMKWLSHAGAIKALEKTPFQERMFKLAKDFFDECKFEIQGIYKVAKFENKQINAQVDHSSGEVFISEEVFEAGLQKLIETIIEESMHLKSGHTDKTRGFQDALIKEMVNIMKNAYAYPI